MSTLALGKYDLFSSIVKASDVYAQIGTDAHVTGQSQLKRNSKDRKRLNNYEIFV
jgi:hypothetical protein